MTKKKVPPKKDVNQLAKHIVDLATGNIKDKKNKKSVQKKG